MTLARTAADIEQPFGPAIVKRGLQLRWWVRSPPATYGAADSAKDISAARWTYRLRTWTSDDDTNPIDDEVVTKGTASSTGELDHYHSNGATVRDTLIWEVVEVDNDTTDATTRTTKREVVKLRWFQPIQDAP